MITFGRAVDNLVRVSYFGETLSEKVLSDSIRIVLDEMEKMWDELMKERAKNEKNETAD